MSTPNGPSAGEEESSPLTPEEIADLEARIDATPLGCMLPVNDREMTYLTRPRGGDVISCIVVRDDIAHISSGHPSDCQSCSEDSYPCAMHRFDYRYWMARAFNAEAMLADHAYKA